MKHLIFLIMLLYHFNTFSGQVTTVVSGHVTGRIPSSMVVEGSITECGPEMKNCPLVMRARIGCYGMNLRSAVTPLEGKSDVRFSFDPYDNEKNIVKVKIPAAKFLYKDQVTDCYGSTNTSEGNTILSLNCAGISYRASFSEDAFSNTRIFSATQQGGGGGNNTYDCYPKDPNDIKPSATYNYYCILDATIEEVSEIYVNDVNIAGDATKLLINQLYPGMLLLGFSGSALTDSLTSGLSLREGGLEVKQFWNEERMGALTSTSEWNFGNNKTVAVTYDASGNSVGLDINPKSFVFQITGKHGNFLDVKAMFPGTDQWCGGFYSPLVLYFDNDRSEFEGMSSFPLAEGSGHFYWPKKGNKAYFLAYDKKGNKKIETGDQLFGNGEGGINGFERLAKLDTNNNKYIDPKDKEFDKLVLWNDKNGDGISQKNEVFTLKEKNVTLISLTSTDFAIKYGKRAVENERAFFKYKAKKGKKGKKLEEKAGVIVDVWVSPHPVDRFKKAIKRDQKTSKNKKKKSESIK